MAELITTQRDVISLRAMATVIIPAAGALLGTIVGALGTFLVTWLNVRAQREQAERARAQHILDVRRGAYVEFMTQANHYYERAREVAEALSSNWTEECIQDSETRYRESWTQLETSLAAVQVLGPKDIAVAARSVEDAAAALGNTMDRWLRSRKQSSTKVGPERDALVGRLEEFAEATRPHFQ